MTSVSAITVPPQVELALQHASRATGTDFDYLLNTAIRESGLKSDAKSKTSSATGLFQFIEQTWLGMVKSSGARAGMGHLASKIERTSDGRHKVTDPKARAEILALRKDPQTSAVMAGVYTQDAARSLENRLGRGVTNGELYIAHFLGAGGAGDLIEAAQNKPQRPAAVMFPKAAAANRSIFYGKSGEALSVAAVYGKLVSRHDNAVVASNTALKPSRTAGPVISPAAARYFAPVNYAARDASASTAWGHGLFAQKGPTDIRPKGAGPVVLSSAIAAQLGNAESEATGTETPANAASEQPARRRGPNGLLQKRISFHTLFSVK